jgi:uncharacterized protein YraI
MEDNKMSTQPSGSRFPWIAVIVAGFLALAGVGLLAYAVLSIVRLPAAPGAAPAVATAKQVPTAIAQSNPTAVSIPTITLAPQAGATQPAVATAEPGAQPATAAPNSPATAVPATDVPATAVPTADLSLKILQPANVRTGPGMVYPIIGGLQAGTSVPVDGRDSSGQWYVIKMGAMQGWVSGIVASYGGDAGALPIIAAPPTPIPTPVPPTATPVPTAIPVPTSPPAPVGYSSHGIVGNSFNMEKTTGAVNEKLWFTFDVQNTSNVTVEYSALAAHTDSGYSAWSWTMQKLKPGEGIQWRDNIKFGATGTYQVYLGICYAGSVDACKSSGWDRLSPSVTVTIE